MSNQVSCLIRVRVTPRSGRDEVIGWQEGALRVRVRAAPVEGQANEALCRLIAKQVGVPYSAVEVVEAIRRARRRCASRAYERMR